MKVLDERHEMLNVVLKLFWIFLGINGYASNCLKFPVRSILSLPQRYDLGRYRLGMSICTLFRVSSKSRLQIFAQEAMTGEVKKSTKFCLVVDSKP